MTARLRWALAAGLGLALGHAAPALAQKGVPPTSVIVGGAAMVSDHDIMDNLSHSTDHTTLLGLLQLAGMTEALRSHGPFTLFAPTNAAFAALPGGMLDSLRKPENKNTLVALLSMQILEGNYSSARLHYLLRYGKGTTQLDTVSEAKLTLTTNGPPNLILKDPRGGTADIILYDAKQANGVVFVIDRVLQPG
ncbi:fasciclin domain-containing protein [Acidisphaera sp. L21]|uniref:fasciclin domain-containing protein n=1 Tax=Acidisphaera sp. L21 TaxID=1641851 RepID=UPI00131D2F1C|nr:fasciclin domain-containing protein [Acidisphaera sp. L21]